MDSAGCSCRGAAAKDGLTTYSTWAKMNFAVKCAQCGAELADGDRFCGECGNGVIASPPASPESGLPPQVVRAAPRRPPTAIVVVMVTGALVMVVAFGL